MSWRVTVPCTRAQGEALSEEETGFDARDEPPVLVADEPDETRPDDWRIHAYFASRPSGDDIAAVVRLGSGPPEIEALGEDDWVSMSQADLQPLRAGRFHVHTPTNAPDPEAVNFEIDAGLAFGTGQHATTAGCLAALDALAVAGRQFANLADIGTGTGLLAFAALALWPGARAIATDIDPIAIDVARENAAINRVTLGQQPGALLLAVADGLDHPLLAARAPFDLIIANILAGPLIELAPAMAASLAEAGTILLAGLLDHQAAAVIDAYARAGLTLLDPGGGEWPVVQLTRTTAG